MAEKIYGLTEGAFQQVREVVRRVQQRMPDVGQRKYGGHSRGMVHMRGKTDAQITKGTVGVVNLWGGADEPEDIVDLGETKNAYSRYATVEADMWVEITHYSSGWEITAAEC